VLSDCEAYFARDLAVLYNGHMPLPVVVSNAKTRKPRLLRPVSLYSSRPARESHCRALIANMPPATPPQTPAMQQYQRMKAEHPQRCCSFACATSTSVLDDAITASRVLEISSRPLKGRPRRAHPDVGVTAPCGLR